MSCFQFQPQAIHVFIQIVIIVQSDFELAKYLKAEFMKKKKVLN
jgi:hypothetical protein